jgi:hypothetical protein
LTNTLIAPGEEKARRQDCNCRFSLYGKTM